MNRRQAAGKSNISGIASIVLQLPAVRYLPGAKAGTFFARDNVSNFITWCRNGLGVIECLLFETDDLIMLKNEKHVILCLLEVFIKKKITNNSEQYFDNNNASNICFRHKNIYCTILTIS